MKHKGLCEVAISRISSTTGQWIQVTITDDASHARVSATLDLETFAQVITGCVQEGDGEWVNHDKVGKRREYEVIEIPISGEGRKWDREVLEKEIRAREVDGWVASFETDEDINHHKVKYREGGYTYAVTYRRWV